MVYSLWQRVDSLHSDGAPTGGDDVAQCDELARSKVSESPNVMRSRTRPSLWVGTLRLNQPRTFEVGIGEAAYRVDLGVGGRLRYLFCAILRLKCKKRTF